MNTFFGYKALIAQQASGFKSTAYALAEIIDNSFDADATQVTIILFEKLHNNRRKIDEIIIADDGTGMSSNMLQNALQFGYTTNDVIEEVIRSRRKGKFGYGLPNASISQCQRVDVYSWQEADKINTIYLDLDEVEQKKSIAMPEIKSSDLPEHYKGALGNLIGKKGTVVAWTKLNRLSHIRGDSLFNSSDELLGRLYRYLIEAGRKIVFKVFEYNPQQRKYIQQGGDSHIRSNDPLFLMPNSVISRELFKASTLNNATGKSAEIFAKFVKSKNECMATNHLLEDYCSPYEFEWQGKKYNFYITTSVADIDIQKPGIREGGGTDPGKFYGKKEAFGNISFVRADREIAAGAFGSPRGSFYNRTVLPHRFWSLEIKFDVDADDLLGVHNNKQDIDFVYSPDFNDDFDKYESDLVQARSQLWFELSTRISSAIKMAIKEIRTQQKEWDIKNIGPGSSSSGDKGPIPQGTDQTAGVVGGVDGPRDGLTDPELKVLQERLIQKYPNIDPEDIKKSVEISEKYLVRATILYAPTESTQLWTYTKVHDFTVVLVNTNHQFYERILSELRFENDIDSLSAIELFLISLAVEEESFVSKPEEKEIIEFYREQVGSKLDRYIKKLPDSLYVDNKAQNEE
jgi:hypothetical protein